jgi:hypothetical protein
LSPDAAPRARPDGGWVWLMKIMLALLATVLLVPAILAAASGAVLLMTVNLPAGVLLAAALVLGGRVALGWVEGRLAWGKPKPGTEVPGITWRCPWP